MVILGLVLIALGAIAVLSAVFVSEGRAELLGMDLSSLAIFLVGVAAGAAILWGYALLKWGTKRGLAHRRERKELHQLNRKLDRVESERRAEGASGAGGADGAAQRDDGSTAGGTADGDRRPQ